MIRIDAKVSPQSLLRPIDRLFELSAPKIALVEKAWDPSAGTPVFTVAGRYTSRGWTEWTQGFQFGSAILQFDATGRPEVAGARPAQTVRRMAPHVTHVGVHDHGFNNVSTYGNLLRLAREGRIAGRRVGARVLRAGAEAVAARSRRRAGPSCPAGSASSTPSTGRIRCSPTPCARCARWRWRTSWATR